MSNYPQQRDPRWQPEQWQPERSDPTAPGRAQPPAPGWQQPPPQYPPPGYPPQHHAPRRRKGHGWLVGCLAAVGGLVVVAVVIIVVALALASNGTPRTPAASGGAGSTVTYVVTGSAADVTYGPAGSDTSGTVPMRKTATIPASAPAYYAIDAQLDNGGTVTCEILVGSTVVAKSTASGAYQIADCEISQDPLSGKWTDTNSG